MMVPNLATLFLFIKLMIQQFMFYLKSSLIDKHHLTCTYIDAISILIIMFILNE